jgi:hypothetical protein
MTSLYQLLMSRSVDLTWEQGLGLHARDGFQVFISQKDNAGTSAVQGHVCGSGKSNRQGRICNSLTFKFQTAPKNT